MAEDFPADKYDYKPTPDVRSFADVMRHVAFWNYFVAKRARGEKADGSANELSKTEAADKASIVAALKKSMAEGSAALQASTAVTGKQLDLWVAFIEHSGEHYGQLVVYYRLNGIVPPASRPQ